MRTIEQKRASQRKSYYKHHYRNKARINANNKIHRNQKKKMAKRFLLFKGCLVCKYKKCDRALDFHHLDPKIKNRAVSRMIYENHSMKRFREEIRKCIVLCANCHREFHAGLINLKEYMNHSSSSSSI